MVEVMYCIDPDCDIDDIRVTKLSHDLWTIDFFAIASTCPVCPHCGNNLSTQPLSVPEAFTRITYPRVTGTG